MSGSVRDDMGACLFFNYVARLLGHLFQRLKCRYVNTLVLLLIASHPKRRDWTWAADKGYSKDVALR